MKKICLLFVSFVAASTLFAQDMFDAMKYGDNSINGTARYMSMAGSFGALGGEVSAISDNPAALGIFRSSEMALSLNAMTSVTNSYWGHDARADKFNFNLNQASYVFSFLSGRETGLVASNLSFSYNRLKSFHRAINVVGGSSLNSMTDYMAGFINGRLTESDMQTTDSYEPFVNENIPWLPLLAYNAYLIDPSGTNGWSSFLGATDQVESQYKAIESGSVGEYNISYAGNISNIFYFGLGVGLQSLEYSITSAYGEKLSNQSNYFFNLNNRFISDGFGYNFKFGFIVRPLSFLRLGFSVHTPTFYRMNDYFYGSIDYYNTGSGTDKKRGTIDGPDGQSGAYRFQSPMKMQASVGFVFGKSALLNFDYLYTDYNETMRLNSTSSSNVNLGSDSWGILNQDIRDYGISTHMYKVGAEVRVAQIIALRGGFAYQTPSMKESAQKLMFENTIRTDPEMFINQGTIYASGGIGFRSRGGFGVDLAYLYSQKSELFRPYNNPDMDPATLKTNNHNAVITFSYRY